MCVVILVDLVVNSLLAQRFDIFSARSYLTKLSTMDDGKDILWSNVSE